MFTAAYVLDALSWTALYVATLCSTSVFYICIYTCTYKSSNHHPEIVIRAHLVAFADHWLQFYPHFVFAISYLWYACHFREFLSYLGSTWPCYPLTHCSGCWTATYIVLHYCLLCAKLSDIMFVLAVVDATETALGDCPIMEFSCLFGTSCLG